MMNAKSVDKYRIIVRHILAMGHRANCGVNRMKFITLTAVPYLMPFIKAELGRPEEEVHLLEASYLSCATKELLWLQCQPSHCPQC